MDIDTFHKIRRMFVVINGTVMFAPANVLMTHHDWLRTMFGDFATLEIVANHTRGYILGDTIQAYQGNNFNSAVKHEDVMNVLRLWKGIKMINFGAIRSQENPWPPEISMWYEDFCSSEMTEGEKLIYIRDKTGLQSLKIREVLRSVKGDIALCLKSLREEVAARLLKGAQ